MAANGLETEAQDEIALPASSRAWGLSGEDAQPGAELRECCALALFTE